MTEPKEPTEQELLERLPANMPSEMQNRLYKLLEVKMDGSDIRHLYFLEIWRLLKSRKFNYALTGRYDQEYERNLINFALNPSQELDERVWTADLKNIMTRYSMGHDSPEQRFIRDKNVSAEDLKNLVDNINELASNYEQLTSGKIPEWLQKADVDEQNITQRFIRYVSVRPGKNQIESIEPIKMFLKRFHPDFMSEHRKEDMRIRGENL